MSIYLDQPDCTRSSTFPFNLTPSPATDFKRICRSFISHASHHLWANGKEQPKQGTTLIALEKFSTKQVTKQHPNKSCVATSLSRVNVSVHENHKSANEVDWCACLADVSQLKSSASLEPDSSLCGCSYPILTCRVLLQIPWGFPKWKLPWSWSTWLFYKMSNTLVETKIGPSFYM